uniref:Uncharacterized protein n=1 Tax=Oryzias latipes TaxID=8090 RepID=A0A3B3I2Q0_ORYLA
RDVYNNLTRYKTTFGFYLIDPLPPLETRKDLALPAIAVTADQSSLKSSMQRLDKRRCRTALPRGSDEFLKTFLKSDAYLDFLFCFS